MTYKRLFGAGACVLSVALILAAAGCATFGKTSGDTRQIAKLLDQWKTAYTARDMGALMRLYPDNYAHKGKDKAGIEKAMAGLMEENAPYDVRVNVADATVTIHGDKATVLPVALSGTAGSDTIRLELTKEDGHWRITGTDL
jgi:ketosteroid isomerase-like protein